MTHKAPKVVWSNCKSNLSVVVLVRVSVPRSIISRRTGPKISLRKLDVAKNGKNKRNEKVY